MGAFTTSCSTLELLDYDCCGESQGILGITYIANNTNYSIFAQHCTTRASRQNRKNTLSRKWVHLLLVLDYNCCGESQQGILGLQCILLIKLSTLSLSSTDRAPESTEQPKVPLVDSLDQARRRRVIVVMVIRKPRRGPTKRSPQAQSVSNELIIVPQRV